MMEKYIKNLLSLSVTLAILFSCTTQPKVVYRDKVIKETIIKTEKQIAKNASANLKNYTLSTKYYPADSQNFRVKYLILHYTVSDFERSVKILTKKNSAHYLITDKDNDSIEILVSEENRAWHAGISNWKTDKNLNDTSIGIEIVNLGYKKENNELVYTDYPDFQIKKVAELCQDIIKRYNILPYNVLGHSDIAPQRKQDPGPKFPWKMLYEKYNIGMWYEVSDKEKHELLYPSDPTLINTEFITNTQKDFQNLGYEISLTGLWDVQTSKVIEAFQHRFRPSNYDGKMDKEIWAILQSLNTKYRNKK